MRKTLTAVVATLAVGAGAGTAEAGPPGKWTQVTGLGQDDLNIMRVGLARTGNGVLHVLWTRNEAGNAACVLHSAVSSNAKSVTGPTTVYAAPNGVNESVDVVRAPDGSLRAFFAATNVFDSVMASATSPDGGSWTVQGPVSKVGPQGKPVYAAGGSARPSERTARSTRSGAIRLQAAAVTTSASTRTPRTESCPAG